MNLPSDEPTVHSEIQEPHGFSSIKVGDYELLDHGQEGGMGVVYRARHLKLDRVVALKMIRNRLASSLQLQRFRAEAEAAATLDHPNIVPIYEVGEHDGQPYLAMKWIEGRSLSKSIAETLGEPGNGSTQAQSSSSTFDSKLQQRHATQLMVKLAHALHHAHQRGIVHRDLKPANVLLDKSGEPFLTDFGLAKRLESSVDLTSPGAILGTPGYMSPEQAGGSTREITTATDVYGLGAIFFCMLTGRAPFVGETPFDILPQVVEREPARPTSIRPSIDRDLETICLKCLEKSPTRRYSTAEAFAQDLEYWLDDKPIQARPVSEWERTWKWIRRHAVISTLVAGVSLSVLLGLVGTTWQWKRAERQSGLTSAANARLALQRAEDLFTADKSHLALATLARVLRDNPKNRAAAERLLNALDQRRFFLPVQQPANGKPAATRRESGPLLLSLPSSDSFQLSNRFTGKVALTVPAAHSASIRCIQFSPDGTRIVTASADANAKVWNPATGSPLLDLKHPGQVNWAEFSLDSAEIATATHWPDSAVRIWNSATGVPWEGSMVIHHGNSVNTVRFLSKSFAEGRRNLLVTSSDDGTARLWYAQTGNPASEPIRAPVAIDDAQEDGPLIRLFLSDGTQTCHRLTSGIRLIPADERELPVPDKNSGPGADFGEITKRLTSRNPGQLTRISVSPDGKLVASGSTDRFARLWSRQSLQLLAELPHDSTVNCVAFSPDGTRLATSTARPTQVRVWDVATGQALSDWIVTDEPVSAVSFSADGAYLITSAGWKWQLHPVSGAAPAWLAGLAESIAGLRYDANGIAQPVPPRDFQIWQSEVLKVPPGNLKIWGMEFLGHEQAR